LTRIPEGTDRMGSSLIERVIKKLRERGLAGTLRAILRSLSSRIRIRLRTHQVRLKEEWKFDRRYGLDTIKSIRVSEMDVWRDKIHHRNNLKFYEPTRLNVFNSIFKNLPIAYEEFLFVDFGSGKGRVLLLAADYPFKKIIGVEISPRINRIALDNINTYRSTSQQCFNIESITGDAPTFPIPDEKAVFYFFNPFDDHIMSHILSNIERSLVRSPREIFIVYINPVYGKLMDDAKFLELVTKQASPFEHEAYSVYTDKASPADH